MRDPIIISKRKENTMKMDKKYFPFTPEQRKNNLEENQASLDISYSEALPPRQKERP